MRRRLAPSAVRILSGRETGRPLIDQQEQQVIKKLGRLRARRRAKAGDRAFLLFSQTSRATILLVSNRGGAMKQKRDVQQGTLVLMVLKTLDMLGPIHGYGIARRVEQISGDLLAVNQGTLYPVLLKLEHDGAIASDWGASENNRRARFYRLTAAGRRQLRAETQDWERTAALMSRFVHAKAGDLK
jgi:PadR family transcriptional regulator, regulatory protein PadR